MKQQTIAALQRLHQALRDAQALPQKDQQLVEKLQKDVESLLARSEEIPSSVHGVRNQIQNAIEQFESSHPELTRVMAATINELVTIGL